jgi:hypothetical protein
MDRFLFLFNDILVIAKPIISTGFTATLDMKYIVKSIVSLDRLHISGIGSEPTTEPGRHIVVQRFIEHFGDDPVAACRYLVDRSNPRVDAITIASLIFKTSELDKGHIGLLLSGNDKLMRAFIDRLHIIGVRIEDALRTFLLSLRLPADPEASQNLLRGFADRYSQVNGDLLGLGRETCTELVLAIMRLNDSLYGMYGFALGTEHLSEKAFVTSWRSTDLEVAVPDDQLLQIYASVRDMALAQALDSKQEKEHGRTVTLTPARLPTKITCNLWTDEIRISLPSTDSDFGIRLLGEGLEFDPPVLDFSRQSDASFRVRGTSLGTRLILFDRFGRNA